MKKIVITGIKGTVGKILEKHLKDEYEIIGLDLPDGDVTDYPLLKKRSLGANTIIHSALDAEFGFMNDLLMAFNVYKVAKENNIPRVIMFSSVHADDSSDWKVGDNTKKVTSVPIPDGPYGAYKVYMESLGRYYAKNGLGVICIRLGGVNPQDNPNLDEKNYQSLYLSHADLVSLIKVCIEAASIKGNYELLYAVSDNEPLIHDFSNNLGWSPKNGTRNK